MLSKTYTKYIQSLHGKKGRDIHHAFIAEGSKVVMELLNNGKIVCTKILATAGWIKENDASIKASFHGPVELIEPFELERISSLSTPNNVLAVFEKPKAIPTEVAGRITLVLDEIQDPGNLGTIIRIADWFGVQAIVCSESCADCFNPKVVQSSMGSISRVALTYTNLQTWLKANNSVPIYAAALGGINTYQLKKLTSAILIVGNESRGISKDIMQLALKKITIPRIGKAESLNAAVATGIILSHLVSGNE